MDPDAACTCATRSKTLPCGCCQHVHAVAKLHYMADATKFA